MTCIVGLRHEGGITIGGDSAGVDGRLGLSVRADEKVFTRDDENGNTWIFGYTTSFRMGQLLRYVLKLPEVPMRDDKAHEFMATRFIDAVRTCFSDGGFQRAVHGEIEGGTFLVGVRGHLYVVHGDYQVGMNVDQYAACGCGEDVALGALYAAGVKEGDLVSAVSAGTIVHIALKAAERHSAGVRGPFRILTVPTPAAVAP